jgi:hypothetical protein
MDERSGTFRVYRVVESVPHLNLQSVGSPRLYTVYQSGYEDPIQRSVGTLRTGERIEATIAGDLEAEAEPWRLTALERLDGVEMSFAVDATPPDVARDGWRPGTAEPTYVPLTDGDERVGVCCLQPREPLPNGAFVPNVVTGLVPLEDHFESIPKVGKPAAEALFIDPDPPDASAHTEPYGVVLLFTPAGRDLADRFRETYDCPRGVDTRPAFDPYGI